MSWREATEDRQPTSADMDERQAEIIGKPLRITPIAPEEVTEEGKALIASLTARYGIEWDGKIAPLYLLMFRNFALFKPEIGLSVHLLFEGTIPPRERELAILRVTWLCGAPNPWGEHVESAKYSGLTADDIRRVALGSAADGWSDHERAVLTGVEELHAKQFVSDETWAQLASAWNEQQLMEFPVLVGYYFTSSINHNTLRSRLSPYNKGITQHLE